MSHLRQQLYNQGHFGIFLQTLLNLDSFIVLVGTIEIEVVLFSSLNYKGKRVYNLGMGSRDQKVKWSWSSALIGAVSATAAASLLSAKPKDPKFHLISIDLTSLKFNLPILDAELMLTVHVTNPNIAPIHFSSTTMTILYDGTVLGSAEVKAGSQPARSCQLLRLPARLNGMELAQHARQFFSDVAKREMKLEAKLTIEGAAKVMWWDHSFRVHVDSFVTVDPVFLDVIGQENKSQMDLFLT